jgi:hypothetical protein
VQIHRDGAVRIPRSAARKPEPVHTDRVHRGAHATALALAGGDASKITIVSPSRIEISDMRDGTYPSHRSALDPAVPA